MNFAGMLLGAAAFLLIGLFHPIVIQAEYHFGTKCWWAFALAGLVLCLISLRIADPILSAMVGVAGFSAFWSILELFQQEKRVKKGWFPKNPNRK